MVKQLHKTYMPFDSTGIQLSAGYGNAGTVVYDCNKNFILHKDNGDTVDERGGGVITEPGRNNEQFITGIILGSNFFG